MEPKINADIMSASTNPITESITNPITEHFTLNDKTVSVKKLIIIIVLIIFAYLILKTYLNVIEIKYMVALNFAQLRRNI